MSDARLIAPETRPDDAPDATLRPQFLSEFVGQAQACANLKVFIEAARKIRLELAADYLVMAAWLAYLKSKLLIPKQPGDDGETGEGSAAPRHRVAGRCRPSGPGRRSGSRAPGRGR